ncbi:Asp-tRNA(Asn)/Glu-tRNA(Gln) amidotransferase subunit GatA [Alicyclobacillus macrosporangiidus]|jgi:aspartyl-tRNA(Asn)/glutamyl-tRNA(Gln) amidotransferase subunit A|uniref:Glutamyl-tRNA(Gln) amidotransferase subunit A n=1 Tax=Alicyclobacillus macrosporangiidus TaxID=392015 RepID=A0A1I7JPY8_9BACL|nr:Asp-tRNA(Asn)/Glu-tRNA(Gln) amidotransferase subunit GatA [Alicyclobacillus macrosporangiidus]SFU87220.1 aspartyl-tRNA(Asn)/glutamyl-tRNA(Gln) amidotransferase subunit A [Alicyclobacillus macrosporangiidus]
MAVHTVKQIMESLRRRESKPSEWAEASLARIRALDERIGAFLHVDEAGALEAARRLDGETPNHPLFGIPYALKDNLCTEGIPTTAASRILEGYVPPYSATVADKLRQAGGVLVGKTNLDEFAMGSSTENSAYKKTRNPYNPACVPGGSSGGSAAAVAAGMVPYALGSDTGGSIRQPASFCGVVGLKPTYGRVSRYGLIAFASSLDQIGPFTRTAEDAAYVLQAISGHDPLDSTSAPEPVDDFVSGLDRGVKGLRIGVVRDLSQEGLDPEVGRLVEAAIATLEGAGAEVVEVSLPHMHYAVATYYLIAPAEASSNLARYDGVRYGKRVSGDSLIDMYERTRSEGFGIEVKRRIMIGTYALSSGYYDAYYLRAQKMRTLIREDYQKAFETCDVIATPTAPTPAFRLGEKVDDPLQMYLNDIYTIPANLAGLPGISVPCGLTEAGLPVGLQLVGRAFDEKTLLAAAHAYEQLRGFEMPLPGVEQ